MTEKRARSIAAAAVGALVLYLAAWPVPIDPIAWSPLEPPPLVGALEPNDALAGVERLDLPFGFGPEDVAVDADGRIYGGLQDGRIVRMDSAGAHVTVFATTDGRPLGLAFDREGNLIVADAFAGLLAVSPAGAIEVLATEADGRPFGFTDDVDIAPDGDIFFSDASDRFDQHAYLDDIMESRPNGRLLRYDPDTREASTVLDSLHFANGVAVSPDGSHVLVVETTRYRVLRHWLEGPRAGDTEVLADNLPGFPDGISTGHSGVYWLALINPRNGLLDALAPRPGARRVVARLPAWALPKEERYAFVIGLDDQGRVRHTLQDPAALRFAHVTSVEQVGGTLYLGSLHEPAIARIPAPR